jgi:hypothetical protein
MDQMTPQHWLDPPYLLANTLASELLTFLNIKSSHCHPVSFSFISLTTAG